MPGRRPARQRRNHVPLQTYAGLPWRAPYGVPPVWERRAWGNGRIRCPTTAECAAPGAAGVNPVTSSGILWPLSSTDEQDPALVDGTDGRDARPDPDEREPTQVMTVTPDGAGQSSRVKKSSVTPWFVDISEPEPLMSSAELRAAIVRGEIPAGTLVWRLGMAGWVPYETVEEIQPPKVHEDAAHEPDVTPVAPNRPVSNAPRDAHTKDTKEMPSDTDPAPPPTSGEPESDEVRGRRPQDTLVDDPERPSTIAKKAKSLWRQAQPSVPPRPSRSPASTAKQARAKPPAKHNAPVRFATTLKGPGSTSAPAGSADLGRTDLNGPSLRPGSANGAGTKAVSAKPSPAKASEEKRTPLPSLRPTAPGLGSGSSPAPSRSRSLPPAAKTDRAPVAAAKTPEQKRPDQQDERPLPIPSVTPPARTASVPSDAPTNPWRHALPVPGDERAKEAVRQALASVGTLREASASLQRAPLEDTSGAVAESNPSAEPEAGPAQRVEEGTVAEQAVTEPERVDSVEPQESTGALETITVVRRKMHALKTRYLHVTVAAATGAAVCAAIVTALLVRSSAPKVQENSVVAVEQRPTTAAAPIASTATAPAASAVEASPTSVEALPTESPPSPQASSVETASTRGEETALHAASRRARARSSAGQATGSASANDPSGGSTRADSNPLRDSSGLEDVEVKPRTARANASNAELPESGSASSEPASGATTPAASSKSWKANDPGF